MEDGNETTTLNTRKEEVLAFAAVLAGSAGFGVLAVGLDRRSADLQLAIVGEPSGLPLRVRTREINPGTGVSEVTVSTWVFAPAYVVVWLGTLVFWQRWKRKKLQEVEP